jgi:hypothetical protein
MMLMGFFIGARFMDEPSPLRNETPDPTLETGESQPQVERDYQKYIWQGKLGPAFWTISGVISLAVNIILIVVVLLLGREVFTLKNMVSDQLVNGLAQNFALMDQAVIRTTVVVNDEIPIKFDLPVSKKTTVILTKDTQIDGARVDLATGGLSITNAPTDILLPAGTPLDIKLNMEIPVEVRVPVTLNVPVNIPLNQTDLHQPFVGLQEVINPYEDLLNRLPNSWEEVLCAEGKDIFCPFLSKNQQ